MSEKVKRIRPMLKYTMLPGLLPRTYELFASGFAYFAFFMAQIYSIVRLIPLGHPYLNSANMGRYGVRHVVAEASRNLVFKRENADQIILYFLLMGGLVLLAAQFFFLLMAVVSPAAMAGSFADYFGVNHPVAGALTTATRESQDIAFILLDRVFGVPDIFESCVTTAVPCYGLTPGLDFDTVNVTNVPQAPWPFHLAMHSMFQFYSVGLLIIAILIVIYYAIAITAETAQTGTPFGKRFNTVWAPLRLVVAIGLLVPIGSGLNSAQYIVLYAAKMGSNMATNGWITFNTTLNAAVADATLINSEEMIGTPNAPSAKELIRFMILAKACSIMEDASMQLDGGTYLNGGEAVIGDNERNGIRPWLVKAIGTPNREPFAASHAQLGSSSSASLGPHPIPATAPSISYQDALTFYERGDILIRFGELNTERYRSYKGGVRPYCGELVLKNSALFEPGALAIQEAYYNMIAQLWDDSDIRDIAISKAREVFPDIPVRIATNDYTTMSSWSATPLQTPPQALSADFTNLEIKYLGDAGTDGTIHNTKSWMKRL